jgi:hypothetical protein
MFSMTRGLLSGAAVLVLAIPAVAAPPVPTSLSIQVAPSSIAPGDSATVTATVLPNSGTINCGKGQIQYNITHPDLTSTGYLQLENDLDLVANQFSAVFDSSLIPVASGDKVTFRAGYASSGGGCNFEGWGPGQSPTADLLVLDGTCPNGQTTGVFISIEGPGGVGNPPPGYSGSWTFTVRVQACEDVYNVTAQGGANGWTENPKTILSASTGSVLPSVKNKNTVYLWNIGNMLQGQDEELVVQVTGSIKNGAGECGKVKLLNGDWSALYALFDGGPKTKSGYTNYTSTITVTCP